MDTGLHGKVVMVTGGAGRIGPVICATFAREGACVGVVDIAAERAAATAAQLGAGGVKATGVGADVSNAAEVDAALRKVTDTLGPVDVLVNAHGISPNRPLLEADEQEWDRTFAVNTRGTMLTCRAVARQMVERGSGGSILNISSGAATSARLGAAGYNPERGCQLDQRDAVRVAGTDTLGELHPRAGEQWRQILLAMKDAGQNLGELVRSPLQRAHGEAPDEEALQQ